VFADILEELGTKGAGIIVGMMLGGLVTLLVAMWKRRRERLRVLAGDARDTVAINLHLVEHGDVPVAGGGTRRVPTAMRIRALGQSQLDRVVPNGHLASVLMERALKVTTREPLISMEGAEGSFLLETLTNFICDRVANCPFEHELYVMAPCCEPAEMAEHQPITILLIAVEDLKLFERWQDCRSLRVEHGTDGARILTLVNLARRFREEQAHIAELRAAGKRTKYVETMYVLDLPLDRRVAAVPTKPVPWNRFEPILRAMNLE
jgi:hypothetical protein